jgi:hypothetical protein
VDLLNLSCCRFLAVISISWTCEGLVGLWVSGNKSSGLLIETIVRLHTELMRTYLIHAESLIGVEVELVGLRRHEILPLLLLVRNSVMWPFTLIVRLLVLSEILRGRHWLRRENRDLIAILHGHLWLNGSLIETRGIITLVRNLLIDLISNSSHQIIVLCLNIFQKV